MLPLEDGTKVLAFLIASEFHRLDTLLLVLERERGQRSEKRARSSKSLGHRIYVPDSDPTGQGHRITKMWYSNPSKETVPACAGGTCPQCSPCGLRSGIQPGGSGARL